MSHPVWVCGLKLHKLISLIQAIMSHPVWVCGLKHNQVKENQPLI